MVGGQSAVAEGAAATVVADVPPLRWSAGTAMRDPWGKKLSAANRTTLCLDKTPDLGRKN